MKKASRSILTMVLTLALVAVLCMPAFAADTFKVSVNGNHQFDLYQVFTGDASNGKLTNLKWGANAKAEGSVEDAAEALVNAADADAYVNYESNAIATVKDGAPAEVASGYYVAKDTTTLAEGDAYSNIIVKVVDKDITISPKNNTAPSFNKKTFDTNDSSYSALGSEMVKYDESGWQDSADYDIGDSVPMRLEGTIPSDIGKYAHYYYAFHDVMEQGLTFEKIENVYVNKQALPADAWTVNTNGNKVDIVIKDIAPYAQAGDVVDVYYTAVLNTAAHNGSYGEINDAYLEYSANPTDKTKPDDKDYPKNTNKTPKDSVIIFTYNVVVNKVDQDEKALAGAEFKLQKKMFDGSLKDVALSVSEDGTKFTAIGVDDGIYVLTETKAPAGYNAIDPVEFEVKANHNAVWETGDRTAVLTSLTGGDLFAGNVEALTVEGNVVNKAGAELPETGGTGTVMLYVLGTLFVIGAGVLMVTKYRVKE